MTETALDARGLKCPLPVMMAAKALRMLEPGTLLRVTATDPLAPADFVDFCLSQRHELLESRNEGGVLEFLIRAGR